MLNIGDIIHLRSVGGYNYDAAGIEFQPINERELAIRIVGKRGAVKAFLWVHPQDFARAVAEALIALNNRGEIGEVESILERTK